MLSIRELYVLIVGVIIIPLSAHSVYSQTGVDNRLSSVLFVISGVPYQSKEKISFREVLEKEDSFKCCVRRILSNEIPDLKDYGVKDTVIIKEIPVMPPVVRPIVILETELPFYTTSFLAGVYKGKQRRQSYELNLKADSTYTFILQKKGKQEVISGRWNISKGRALLYQNSSQRHTQPASDTIPLTINSPHRKKGITLPQKSWDNKRPVKLKLKK